MEGQTTTFSMRLSPELRERLDSEAARTGQSKAQVAAQALEEFLPERNLDDKNLREINAFFSRIEETRNKLKASGFKFRSGSEIDRSIRELRDD